MSSSPIKVRSAGDAARGDSARGDSPRVSAGSSPPASLAGSLSPVAAASTSSSHADDIHDEPPPSPSNRDGGTAERAAGFGYTGPSFIRGDVDGDGVPDLTDAIAVLEYLFRHGVVPCEKAADSNDDGFLDLSDAIAVLFYLFSGGPSIPEPFPTAGQDPTPDGLSCGPAS